ncbi:MAG: OsmC family protein [Luminiphilus sp.]|jgi:peroxiredoxin-like protein|nr:OsmC family protein [Luminiphilus sp.]
MQDFPHYYRCVATANADQSRVRISSNGLEDLSTDVPTEFGGPGDQWSPEALLIAAVADCFVLTFRAMAKPSRVTWYALDCDATGTLERADRSTRFTEIQLSVRISIPDDLEEEKVLRVLKKAEENCLITNSLTATVTLNTDITRQSSAV